MRIRRIEVRGYISLRPRRDTPRYVSTAVQKLLAQHEKRQTRSASNAQIVINLLIFICISSMYYLKAPTLLIAKRFTEQLYFISILQATDFERERYR